MDDKIFMIGNKDDFVEFEKNPKNTDLLPVQNLPMSYFPFFYNKQESSLEKMKRLVPLFETNSDIKEGTVGSIAENTIDTETLFVLLTTLEDSYQPFNNNYIFHINIVIVSFWVMFLYLLLMVVSYFSDRYYSYLIVIAIALLLVIASMWALIVTSKSF